MRIEKGKRQRDRENDRETARQARATTYVKTDDAPHVEEMARGDIALTERGGTVGMQKGNQHVAGKSASQGDRREEACQGCVSRAIYDRGDDR